MWEKGQRTKQIHFWLSGEDVSAFSDALHEAMPAMQWQCRHPSPDHLLVHDHDTLRAALDCGGEGGLSQAFAPMGLSALQFLIFYRRQMSDPKDPAGSVLPPVIDMVESGRMAIRWNAQDGDDAVLAAFTAQLKAIWTIFRRSTLPAKVRTTSGHPASGFRIGRRMLEIARADGLYLSSPGCFYRLDQAMVRTANSPVACS